ncbi:uncharacterized protein LOC108914906 [Anoplophora glabripennis]|uniref:uncharacterized protein LOC108914906 n=1 Tax=Anoplophora glabripennis TaxID=217634 RepID=UPI000874EDC4|nr:uncharacterized protein LOC108914906 [Anoplophora glabripennis]
MDKLPQIKRETELQNSNEKHSIQNVEIIEDCCCCSPSTSTTTILNKTEIKRKTNTTFSISAVSSSNDKLECVDLKASDNLKTADAERNDKNAGICSEMLLEDMFPDESEEDQDLQDLIAMLTDSIDVDPNPLSCQEEETGNKRIDHNSHTKLTPEDVPLDMTGMEHYKKRLIHQHEKPSGLSSPCTTTEEDDDSIESPLSPASSVQSRESCQQDKKRDEVVQKVARKRAVCRSQFRHQSMELFKLGSSIPTSLCKTKEPYNVCAEKNLQMCYQNGGLKKCDKNPSKGSLTESIINTIEGGKKKEGSLWRSVSLNNEISTSSNSNNRETKNSGNGRHILPAIVPELPERRKNRVKSLPENSSKSNNEIEKNNNSNEACSKSVYEFAENDGPDISPPVETISKKPTVKQKPLEESQESSKTQDITEARVQNPTASELDVPDCTPINLSLKKQDRPSWTDLFNIHHPKRNELNNNQHLTHTILKQPSNVPTKPAHFHDSNVPRTHADQKTVISENLDSRHVDKDGNCFFVTAIPSAALDPQKQSNVIVINFPHIQQQMSRMEKPNVTLPGPPEAQQSPLEMLDSAIMSLINIVKSSVESAFNILSLPVLNRLYIDLSRYLLLPTVSVKMKACIEEALNVLISYLLVNLFRTPRNSRARDFVHKMLQLDLRPHMDFLIHSLDVIQQKIKYEYFTDHLLKVLSHNPQEDFVMPLPRNVRRPFGDFPNVRPAPPPPHPFFPNQNQSSEFRDYPPNRFWMENQVYQHGNVAMPNMEFPKNQSHRRSRRQGDQESDKHLLATMRVPENFNEPNLVMMGPDLYLADNRCIPPNMSHIHPKVLLNAPLQQPRSKGRPRNSSRINKMPKLSDNSLDLTVIPQTVKHRGTPEENQIFNHREKTVNIPNSNVSDARRAIRRHSDMIEESAHTRNRQQVLENRRLSEGAMIPNQAIENGVNVFSGNNFRIMTGTREVHKTVNGENDNYFRNSLMYAQQATANYDKNARIPRNNIRNYAETGSKHFPANVEAPTSGGNTVIVGNEIVQCKEQIGEFKTKNTPRIITKQCTGSDVEQYLQTNIIVNKYQATSVICEPVLKNLKPPTNTYDGSGTAVSNIGEKVVNIEQFHGKGSNFETNVYKNHIPNTKQASRTADSETVEKQSGYDKREESWCSSKAKAAKPNDVPEVIANTVIIKDKSMEISKGAVSSSAVTNTMDLDDVVLEKVSPTGDLKHGISYTTSRGEGPPKVITDGGNYQERLSLVTDVSIEKITDEYDVPPKLIKLATLKRKTAHDERQQRKLVKRWPSPKEMTGGDIVVIEDEEKIKELKKLDCNQNDVTKTEKFSRKPITDAINSVVASNTSINKDKSNKPTVSGERSNVKPVPPMIEDISSEEEVLEPFRLYSTYDNKVPGDPRKILQTMEVSHCTLIEGNVKAIQDANRHLFEKPPVYTRPVMPPRNLRKPPAEDNPANRKEPLANLVQFKEDSDTLTCSLKVKNSELKYPSNMDVRRFSPGTGYQVAAEDVSPIRSPKFSPNFKSPPRPTNAPSAVVQMSHMVPRPPIAQAPAAVPVVQTSPVPSKSPAVRMSPVPVIPKLAIDRTSPAVRQVSPRLPGPPPLNESNMNWGHWFSEEQRKGVFNFERSQSMESSTLSGRQSAEALSSAGSDYCSKFSPEEPLCEIKIDSKPYRIKKSIFKKIPKGKLCYIRESNSFVRYFDDKQMELFISNLNLGEGSTVASDLLKQIRSRGEGPASLGSPTGHYETSGKGEVITLSKDVVFSSEDFLSDPEQYVEEVEKVQRYVPKDFYGFYKFVTGYQIVNHHPPISFLTFLTMHNTNGIRGLFKNYVNTLAEGRSIL